MRVTDPLETDSTRLRRFRSAVGARDARIVAITDSWGDGNGAADFDTSWLRRLHKQLNDYYFPGVTHGSTYITASSPPVHAATRPIVPTGTGNGQDYMGLQRRVRELAMSGTFTFTFTGTGFQLFIGGNGTVPPAFNYTVDGGASTPYLGTSRPSGSEWPDFVLTVTGLSNTSHTIALTSTISQLFILGLKAYGASTSGIHMYENSRGGTGTTYWLTTPHRWARQVEAIDPHLVLIQLGINDFQAAGQQVTAAQFKTNLEALIAVVRSYSNDPSIVLQMPPEPSGTGLSPWLDYLAAIVEVAEEDGAVALFDSRIVFGDTITNNDWGFYHDGFHIPSRGHRALADADVSLLTRVP